MADTVVTLRKTARLSLEARIVAAPAEASGYPGASLSTWYVCRMARYSVGDVLRCDPLLLIGKPRGERKMAFARQLAIHLAHIVAGRRHDEVAHHFNRNRSTASHHFEVLENLRDVPEFDTFMEAIESRFAHQLRAAETKPVELWGEALEAMGRAVTGGHLDVDTHFDAKFVAQTFRARDMRRRSR